MKIWIDAQLSPNIARWIQSNFDIEAVPVRELGLRDAKDIEIFRAARQEGVVVLSKDADFPHLLSQHGPPPKVLWLTCGNTSDKMGRDSPPLCFYKTSHLLGASFSGQQWERTTMTRPLSFSGRDSSRSKRILRQQKDKQLRIQVAEIKSFLTDKSKSED